MLPLHNPGGFSTLERSFFRFREIRLIPAVDRSPSVVRFAQTIVGRAVLLFVYGLILFLHGDWHKWLPPLALALPTFFPAHRRKFVVLITVAVLLVRPYSSSLNNIAREHGIRSMGLLHCALTLAALAICACYAYIALTLATSILGRRPIASVLCLFGALVVGASLLSVKSGLAPLLFAALVVALSHFLWFLCYTLKSRGPRTFRQLLFEVGHYSPFWYINSGGGGTPVPKGSSFLDRIEAKTPEALAICQLKGIKLTLWAWMLTCLRDALLSLAYGKPSFATAIFGSQGLGIVPFKDAMAMSVIGEPLPFYAGWLSLGAHFFINRLLTLAIGLHFSIGLCRMAGFCALRGVYRPFSARSFADFWNRVHYYFKELMLEVFFYPVYFRYFKAYPRARMIFAVFAAVFFGNWLYHVLRDVEWITINGLGAALDKWSTYALYTFLLALGIAISLLRSAKRAAEPAPWPARAGSTAAVVLSYCLLGILDDNGGASSRDCARFFLELAPPIGALSRPLL